MESIKDQVKLIRNAQLGHKDSQNELAEAARVRLYEYVYRITLREDLTQDIVQESLLKMFKILSTLDKEERFWPWLFRIAYNIIRNQRRREKIRKTVPLSGLGGGGESGFHAGNSKEGLESLLSRELKQIVFASMRELKPRHRDVLTMRCYNDMGYSQIAEVMDCSEFGVRMLFYRAKKSLQKQLSRNGIGKGSMLMILALFGKMTAQSEATAAAVSVTAGTLKVGTTAAAVGAAGTKTAVLSLAAAGALTIGSIVSLPNTNHKAETLSQGLINGDEIVEQVAKASKGPSECWYYFPQGTDEPVMMRQLKWGPKGEHPYCQWLQNDDLNYFFDWGKNTIHLNNYRMWQSDLAVRRLPTDSQELSEFLLLVDGLGTPMKCVPIDKDNLWVIVRPNGDEGHQRTQVNYHSNILKEEFFQYSWPVEARLVDNRDAMHKQGWGYFQIRGNLGGERISGVGRVPFVYGAYKQNSPFLRLQVARQSGELEITDGANGAYIRNSSGYVVAEYPAGTFFEGLARPWTGLHTVDTVRRDAAERRMWFSSRYTAGKSKVEVTITTKEVGSSDELVYLIDMGRDAIEKITFSATDDPGGKKTGVLAFSYVEDMDTSLFESGSVKSRPGRKTNTSKEMEELWLVRLAKGTLGQN